MRMHKYFALLAIGVMIFLVYGLHGSPIYGLGDFEIEVGYINGILTAMSILFGIWAFSLRRRPTGPTKKFVYDTVIKETFLFAFILLMISVVFVCLTAFKLLSSIATLLFSAFSFSLDAFLIMLTLHYFKFKDYEDEEFVKNLRVKCSNCGKWKKISVYKGLIEQSSLEPKAKAMILGYEPLQVFRCEKCGNVIAEPTELIRITRSESK